MKQVSCYRRRPSAQRTGVTGAYFDLATGETGQDFGATKALDIALRTTLEKASGGAGLLNKLPWYAPQLCARRNCNCSGVSTPTATTLNRSSLASAQIALTIVVFSLCPGRPARKERSILISSMGKRPRWTIDEVLIQKSFSASLTPISLSS